MGCYSDRDAKESHKDSRENSNQTIIGVLGPDAENTLERCYEQVMQLISLQLTLCSQALKLPAPPYPPLPPRPDSLATFSRNLIEGLSRLESAVTTLARAYTGADVELKSLKISNTLMKSILKARENDLELLGEDYYAFATQRNPGSETTHRISVLPSPIGNLSNGEVTQEFPETIQDQEEERNRSPMYKRGNFLESIQKSENLEQFVLVLHLDSERQYESQQTAFKQWSHLTQSAQLVRGMAQSDLENITLEGSLKAKLLKSNPIIAYLASGVLVLDEQMPAYELFPILFQTLDSAIELGKREKSFPTVVLEYLSMTLPIKSKMHQFLGTLFLSLQTFYAEGDPYAVFFARMLRVFHPDPLLDTVTHALLSINATISNKTSKKKKVLKVRMTDEETGGNVFVASALECAFKLLFSTDVSLFRHFLGCIKPAELSDLEWAAFVIACKAEYLMIDLTPVSINELQDHLHYLKHVLNLEAVATWLAPASLSPDSITQLFNSRVYAEIKDLLFLPRGLVLDAFLQVYDLYVESLFPVLADLSRDQAVTREELYECLQRLSATITERECGLVWESALHFNSGEVSHPTKDAVHLAIITSSTPSIAVKPLLMKEGEAETQLKTTRAMNFDYRNRRLSARFSSEARTGTSHQERRSYRVRVNRDLSRLDQGA